MYTGVTRLEDAENNNSLSRAYPGDLSDMSKLKRAAIETAREHSPAGDNQGHSERYLHLTPSSDAGKSVFEAIQKSD